MSETALEGKRAFDFMRTNEREGKPRSRGVTEIRGAYYTPVGKRYLSDVLETMGECVDSLKFAGGSFTLMPDEALKDIIEIAHEHEVMVSPGRFVEYVLTQGPDAVDRYIRACREVGSDIIELSGGFVSIPTDDWLGLVERVQKVGLKAKPEVGIQFGAGGHRRRGASDREHPRPKVNDLPAKRFIDAGAYMIMIESEGITENADPWRTDVPAEVINSLGWRR